MSGGCCRQPDNARVTTTNDLAPPLTCRCYLLAVSRPFFYLFRNILYELILRLKTWKWFKNGGKNGIQSTLRTDWSLYMLFWGERCSNSISAINSPSTCLPDILALQMQSKEAGGNLPNFAIGSCSLLSGRIVLCLVTESDSRAGEKEKHYLLVI